MTVRKRRHLMSDFVIREVAYCGQGMNPEANILLYKQNDSGDGHVDAPMGGRRRRRSEDPCEAARRRARRRRRTRRAVDAIAKQVDATTSNVNGHSHAVRLPTVPVQEGRYRTARAGGHDHGLVIPRDLGPGASVSLETTPGGGDGHVHQVRIRVPGRARQAVDAILEKIGALDPGANLAELDELHEQLHEAIELAKQDDEDEEPPTFDQVLLDRRLLEIDSALDRRAHALIETTTHIMRSDSAEKEGLVLEAVAAYAETMNREVPELFAGRLAKWIAETTASAAPDAETCFRLVKAELETAGLVPLAKENPMDFLSKLTKRGKDALAFVLKGRKAEELFAELENTDGQTILVGLLDKAGEWADQIDTLEKALETAKVQKASDEPPTLEDMLKTIPAGQRPFFEAQAAAQKSQAAELRKLREERIDARVESILKAVPSIPAEGLKDALRKAHDAGILETIEKTLQGAEEIAKLGKAYQELEGEGLGLTAGELEARGMDAEAADQALISKAAELRKALPTLSAEQAYAKACDDNPALFEAAAGQRS